VGLLACFPSTSDVGSLDLQRGSSKARGGSGFTYLGNLAEAGVPRSDAGRLSALFSGVGVVELVVISEALSAPALQLLALSFATHE
jgi:hypothetical protein